MAVVKAKPTSPGRRFRSLQTGKDLYKGRPLSSLVTKKSKTGGRNNAGRITTRHIGGDISNTIGLLISKGTRIISPQR